MNNQQNNNYNQIKNDLNRIKWILGIINLSLEDHGLINSVLVLVNKIDTEIDTYNNYNVNLQQVHNQQLQTILDTVQNYIVPN